MTGGIHLSLLLLGGLLAAAPVVLHLVMRRKPKHYIFPALRFVQQRRETNRRQLRLRHWLLLLIRCLAVLLVVVALATANLSVASAYIANWVIASLLALAMALCAVLLAVAVVERKSTLAMGGLAAITAVLAVGVTGLLWSTLAAGGEVRYGAQEAPVAAVLVIDNSPRMAYKNENVTRLQKAQSIGGWLLEQLPPGSEVAISPATSTEPAFSVDSAAARSTLERMELNSLAQPLPGVVARAVRKVQSSVLERKEVYIFTDLTQSAWADAAGSGSLKLELKASPDVLIYVIDTGVEQPLNLAVGDLELSQQTVAANGSLDIATTVASEGVTGAVNVELYIEQQDPSLPIDEDNRRKLPLAVRRAQQTVELTPGAAQRVKFPGVKFEQGVNFGHIKITREDGLAADNTRHFTVEARQAWPVLVAAPPGVQTSFLTEAIAPYEFRESDQAQYRITTTPQTKLANFNLKDYAAVVLLDPLPLTPGEWEQLTAFTRQGGSLAVFLGHNASAVESFNAEPAQRLLPGRLGGLPWRSASGELHLAPQRYQHPVLTPLRPVATTVPWRNFPVFRHWNLTTVDPDAEVVVRYSNNRPALLEQKVGAGLVMTMTTPVSDPLYRRGGRSPWNELPTGENPWPYFVVINEIASQLVAGGRSSLNYQAGQTAVLVNDPARDPAAYTLFAPDESPREEKPAGGRLTIGFTENPGAYRLKGLRADGKGAVVRGFSVNLPASATRLARAADGRLDDLFGQGAYQLARSREEIQRKQGDARVGRQFYPYLILMFAVMLGLEHLLANWFYKD